MTEQTARVLVADDEPNILMLTSVMLKDAGYEVIKAENGKQAIDMTMSERPDLVITDVIMPEKNGFEVCQAIRSNPETSQIPIIILSALGDAYNKITGFEDGADDYVTKPFNIEELKARVLALLVRSRGRLNESTSAPVVATSVGVNNISTKQSGIVDQIPSGSSAIDTILDGGLPKGGNILVVGQIGGGKSSLSRKFIETGLNLGDKSMYITLDDDPSLIRKMLTASLGTELSDYEQSSQLRLVDAYTWSSGGGTQSSEQYSVSGVLELNQLSGVIADASVDLGQTIQAKAGGRRILDSISSLLVNFELPSVQRFLSQIARTAISFGGVTSLFLLEEGAVSDQVLNNVKYLMDGVIELKEEDGQSLARVSNMKWINYSKDWVVW